MANNNEYNLQLNEPLNEDQPNDEQPLTLRDYLPHSNLDPDTVNLQVLDALITYRSDPVDPSLLHLTARIQIYDPSMAGNPVNPEGESESESDSDVENPPPAVQEANEYQGRVEIREIREIWHNTRAYQNPLLQPEEVSSSSD